MCERGGEDVGRLGGQIVDVRLKVFIIRELGFSSSSWNPSLVSLLISL